MPDQQIWYKIVHVTSLYFYLNIWSEIDCMMYAAIFDLFEEVMSKFEVNALLRRGKLQEIRNLRRIILVNETTQSF